jgi:hypothetical protein
VTAIRNEFSLHPDATLLDKLLEIDIEAWAQRAVAHMEAKDAAEARKAMDRMIALRNQRRVELVRAVELDKLQRVATPAYAP